MGLDRSCLQAKAVGTIKKTHLKKLGRSSSDMKLENCEKWLKDCPLSSEVISEYPGLSQKDKH